MKAPGLNLSKAFLLEQVPSGKNSTWGHLPPEVARRRTSSTTLRREAGSWRDTRMAWLKRRRAGVQEKIQSSYQGR